MIDMHMHTLYSDGDKTVEEILKMCEAKKLEYISLTDHNTCKEYEDDALNKGIFSGKIIKGVEMNATFKNKKIEILGYNIKDTKIIEDWSQKFFSTEVLKKQQEESKKKLLAICDKKGLIYDESKIKQDIPLTDFITIYIYKELIKHKVNLEILGEFANSLNLFIRKGLMNPESEYYVLAYDTTSNTASAYVTYAGYYTDEAENPLKIYYLDLNEGFNKEYYVSEESNPKAQKISDLKMLDGTLLRIKDGKIVEYIEGIENIAAELKVTTEED